ncbi:hypothetical protein EDB85DRAFT_278207 [Lactarius pseudohatsudake]|nr:hypothetical protein EDB85DRAFT_278207 [Lactarius pseudohatsudake]
MMPDCSSLARLSSPTSSTLLRGSKCRPIPIPTDSPFHEGVATRKRLLLSAPQAWRPISQTRAAFATVSPSSKAHRPQPLCRKVLRCLLARVAIDLLLGLAVLSLLTSQRTVAPVMVSFTSTQPASDTCYSRVTHVGCRLITIFSSIDGLHDVLKRTTWDGFPFVPKFVPVHQACLRANHVANCFVKGIGHVRHCVRVASLNPCADLAMGHSERGLPRPDTRMGDSSWKRWSWLSGSD